MERKPRLSKQLYDILADHQMSPRGAAWFLRRARQCRDKIVREAFDDELASKNERKPLTPTQKAMAVKMAHESYATAVDVVRTSMTDAATIEKVVDAALDGAEQRDRHIQINVIMPEDKPPPKEETKE